MQRLTKSQVGKYMLENRHVFVDVENEMWYIKAIKHHKSGTVLVIAQDDKEKNYYPGSNEILEFYTNEQIVFNEKVYVEVEGGIVTKVLAKEGIDVHVRDIDAESEIDGNVVLVFDENNATEKEIHRAITEANKAQVKNMEYSNQ